MKEKTRIASIVAAVVGFDLLVFPFWASATENMYNTIATAVSFTDVIAGLGLVAVAIAGVLIAKKGAMMLLHFIGK